jgi:hypothetical protein
MSTNLFNAPGWNLVKVIPQRTSTKDKCNKKRKTQEQSLLEKNNKKRRLNSEVDRKEKINECKNERKEKNNNKNKNRELKRFDKNNVSRKSAQPTKGQKLKEYQVEQKKQTINSKKSRLKVVFSFNVFLEINIINLFILLAVHGF